jgi:hypothetical protein
MILELIILISYTLVWFLVGIAFHELGHIFMYYTIKKRLPETYIYRRGIVVNVADLTTVEAKKVALTGILWGIAPIAIACPPMLIPYIIGCKHDIKMILYF